MTEARVDREQIVEEHGGLARGLARRFQGRGEPLDDLEQVAMIGLIKAADRFDPDHGSRFESFAAVTIMGELKRHLRDKAWTVRVPRGLKEASRQVNRAIDELGQQLGRSPSVREVAAHLGVSDESVIEALQVGSAYTPASLEMPVGDDDAATLGDFVGSEDETLEMSGRWADATSAIEALDERERHIVYARFFEGKTQSEIAADLGMSQMHVSRLLRKSLDQLREVIGGA